MDLILFGKQGSGKGTQVVNLTERDGYKIFAMSGELKKVVNSGSELGEKVKAVMASGALVSDDLIMKIVENWALNDLPAEPVLFDGIPRTVAQMDKFEEIMSGAGRDVKGLLINISNEEATRRMLSRRITTDGTPVPPDYAGETYKGMEITRRADDQSDAIAKRLALYDEQTMPVVEKYREGGRLIEVDGTMSIEEVYTEIKKALV